MGERLLFCGVGAPGSIMKIVKVLDEGLNTSLCSMTTQQFGQPTSVAIEARLKALLRENIIRWGEESLGGTGGSVEWETKGNELLRNVECPPYVASILSVYRTKD